MYDRHVSDTKTGRLKVAGVSALSMAENVLLVY